MLTAEKMPTDFPVHRRRVFKRYDYTASCVIRWDGETIPTTTCNISTGGINLRFENAIEIPVGETVTLAIADFQPIDAAVRWRSDGICGLQFLSSLELNPELSSLLNDLEIA